MRQHRITTPEQVHFHYTVSGLVTRAAAWALDQVLLLSAVMAVAWSAIGLGFTWGPIVILLAKFALDFGYFAFFELRWAGQSPGKRVMGIRVISARGGKLQFSDVLMRSLVRTIDSPFGIPFVGLVGGGVALLDPLHRRLGDLASDTIVIQDARVKLPQTVVAHRARANTYAADPAIRRRVEARVTAEERDLMLDLMLRRDDLEAGAREVLFQEAAGHFRRRYSLPDDLDYLSDEQAVLNLALLVQSSSVLG